MRKLLVAVDGSEPASRAVEYAVALAKAYGISLHLVTVLPDPIIYGEIQVYVSHERFNELQLEQGQALLKAAIAQANEAGLSPTSEVMIGDIASAIIGAAKTQDCDGIVMGTRGMGAISNLFMGSIAIKVVHLAETPVTLVK